MPERSKRAERINLSITTTVDADLKLIAERLGVSKPVAAAVALSMGLQALKQQFGISGVDAGEGSSSSGVSPRPVAVPSDHVGFRPGGKSEIETDEWVPTVGYMAGL